jgi:geranylgeranyl diphosphate/geranylgeranyl-bacteriochlorophyllide a reductase
MDVAIIGAGPAGSWTAYRLARAGARVAIFDSSHPREKPCGGGVTGRALALVGDALADADVPVRRITAARFTSDGGRDARVALGSGSLVVASREAFDAALLASAVRAGATLHPSRATDVQVDRTGARVLTSGGDYRARHVVGADGANSLVRRRVSQPFRRSQLSIATGYFARGATSGEIVIELTPNPPGYVWSFPRPNHLAIGICAQADAGAGVDALRAQCAAWIARSGVAPGAALQPYSWPIPSLRADDFALERFAGPSWCLVGDAAGLVDPITREGIFFALQSAEIAADALASGDPERTYAARVHAEIGEELARAARLKAGFFRPAFSRLLLRALSESEAVRQVMVDLIAGTQSYRTLKWRLLQTLELGLAWRTVRTLVSRT